MLSPDNKTLYLAGPNATIQVYDVATQVVTTLPSPVYPLALAITPDGTTLVATSAASSHAYNIGVINIANPSINARILIGGNTVGVSIP